LRYNAEDKRINFAVRDTGKGITDEELAHIWDRYYRSKDSHLRPVKGTGLGLNIVKAILQKHGFNFGVKTKQGEGSTFYVDFPSA
ncbi:MAG: HAMP domain-containing histidine kinase, partial [Clostridia bacterium]|nr:HAMP domain-containing histidine kinase [Clostridia bacterium]